MQTKGMGMKIKVLCVLFGLTSLVLVVGCLIVTVPWAILRAIRGESASVALIFLPGKIMCFLLKGLGLVRQSWRIARDIDYHKARLHF